MSEPRRLLEDPDFAGTLLRSAQEDAPGRDARRRTMIALGIGTGILGASVTAGTSAAASTATGATGILKWFGIGVIGGGLAVGGAQQALHFTTPHITAPAVKGQAAVAARVTKPLLAGLRAHVAAPTPDASVDPPAVDAPPPEVSAAEAKPAARTAKGSSAASLADEVAELDRAREALRNGDSASALAALDRHDKKFGTALLGPEAMVMRIETLSQRGDKTGAAALANQFLALYPRSVQANRVRSILANSVNGQ